MAFKGKETGHQQALWLSSLPRALLCNIIVFRHFFCMTSGNSLPKKLSWKSTTIKQTQAMKWKPDEWVCVIRVKRFLLTALWSDLCSVHKTLFHGLHLHMSLTWQVLLGVRCLALLPNVMRCRKTRLPSSVAIQTTLLGLQPSSPWALNLCPCVRQHLQQEGGLAPLPPLPFLPLCTPSSFHPSHTCSGLVFRNYVLGSSTHWRAPFLPTPFI